jgi:hypothetical protein
MKFIGSYWDSHAALVCSRHRRPCHDGRFFSFLNRNLVPNAPRVKWIWAS